MKNRALTFIFVVLLALSIVPAVNVSERGFRDFLPNRADERPVLYAVDFVLPYINRLFYALGVSIQPNKIMIGNNDWLYIGDLYERALTVIRYEATPEDAATARKIGIATQAWAELFKRNGVRLYKIMLVPDKGTVYPEFLPGWVRPAAFNATDMLISTTSRDIYVDTRPALRMEKIGHSEPLYYRTDTHWNALGAWVAFRAFTDEIAKAEPELQWLTAQQVQVSNVHDGPGRDLARFLKLTDSLRDTELTIDLDRVPPIETEQYDFESGKLKMSGGNPQVGTPGSPLLVKSRFALNHKKVLWLRDSFGDAISPYMAATFSETLQLNYGTIDPEQFARLIAEYKPDYVFITVVERLARSKWFELPPPQTPAAR